MTHWEVLASFTRIRETAEAYMDELDELGHGWVEESVTDVAVHRGYPHVKVIKFNRRQEAVVGGDYLWWWLDSSSSLCFGMLVQAKRLSREGSRWHIDISHNDGQQLRDYVFVEDCARANLELLTCGGGDTFNLGSARGTSVNTLFTELAKITGYEQPAIYAPARPGEIFKTYLTAAHAREVFGWEPQVSLEQGLRRTVEYFKT